MRQIYYPIRCHTLHPKAHGENSYLSFHHRLPCFYLLLDTADVFERKKMKLFYRFSKNARKLLWHKAFHSSVEVVWFLSETFLICCFFRLYRKVNEKTSTTSTEYWKSIIPSSFPTVPVETIHEAAGLSFHLQSMKMLYSPGFSLKSAGRGRSFP